MTRTRRSGGQSRVVGLVLLAPYLVLLVAFAVVPIVLAATTSVRPSPRSPEGGIQNYINVVEDFRFLPAAANVGLFLLIYLPLTLIVVVLMSILLDSVSRRTNLPLRLAYIVPAAISGSVAVLVWYFLLEPNLSPYRDLMHAVGITRGEQIWNAGNLPWIFALMAFFTGVGNWIVVQYGSLQSVPDEVTEAALIDGCNAAQTAIYIKLPMIKKYLVFMTVLTLAAGLQVFVEPQLISTSVYPGLGANWSLNQVSYNLAFASADLGSAAALSLMLLAVCLAAAVLVIFRTDFFEGVGVRKSS